MPGRTDASSCSPTISPCPAFAVQIVTDALRFCPAADPATAARRAAAAGWTAALPPHGLSVAARAPGSDEQLAAAETVQPTERLATCSVFTKAHVGGVDAQLAQALGTTPLFRYAGSSTYRAWRSGSGWRSPPTDPATFAHARAAGEIYSLIVTDDANGSGVVIVNPRRAAAP